MEISLNRLSFLGSFDEAWGHRVLAHPTFMQDLVVPGFVRQSLDKTLFL